MGSNNVKHTLQNNGSPQNFSHIQNTHNQNFQQNVPRYRNFQNPTYSNSRDSNQSRIRRYGAPIPMEIDTQNFCIHASEDYSQPLN